MEWDSPGQFLRHEPREHTASNNCRSFEGRDECEDIIRKYHGASIGEEGMLMQVRYADTPAQKELKRITAKRRQFRTNEYNIGAYGTADVGIHPSIYQQAPWNRRASAGVGVGVNA